MDRQRKSHDIIVIGGSAGAIEIVRNLVAELPAQFPAAAFLVIHGASARLADVLAAAAQIDIVQARPGQRIATGCLYVAAPGKHLMLHDDHVLVRRGPRENLSRPAIDPLFRTAAASFGGRVVGVLLSGALNDGTAGLSAIKRMNGIAVVQDPATALYSSMPQSAIANVPVDYVAGPAELPKLLLALLQQPAEATPEIPFDMRLESAIAAQELADMKTEDRLGTPSRFICPECHGVLWEIDDPEGILRYRCHIGHAFTAEAALSAQTAEIDELLQNLMRSHQERAALARRMAEQKRAHRQDSLANEFAARARDYAEDAELMRRLLQQGNRSAQNMGNDDLGNNWPDENASEQGA